MSKIDETTTSISFQGDDVHAVLEDNPLMHQAIWGAVASMRDANITVHTAPRVRPAARLEWQMIISSPQGRRSVLAIQRRPSSSVEFRNDS